MRNMYESKKDPFNSNIFHSNMHNNYSNFRNIVPPPELKTEEKPKEDELTKKKTNRKKINNPIQLEELLKNEKPKEKKKKKSPAVVGPQSVNISNTNPCIINQNNYYNGYNMPPGHYAQPICPEIPEPVKFMDKNKQNHHYNYNMMNNNYMYMPDPHMYYYPHPPYQYPMPPRGNEYKKPK